MAALILILACPPADAGVSGAVTATGNVIADCTTVTPSSSTLTIGNAYDPFTYPAGTPLRNTTAITLSTTCTQGDTISWTVGDGGNCNKGAVASDRAMANGANYLSYELYTTNAFTTQWSTNGCGTPAATTQSSGGTVTPNSISLFGAVPGGQNVAKGTYSDSVTVTLNY